MKTKYKVIIAVCCVLLAGCITTAVILLMPNRTTADNDEVDPSEVDKFTVDDEYKDVLAEIKDEMTEYYDPAGYAQLDLIEYVYTSPRDLSITEDSIAGKKLYDGHMFSDWETNGFDESTLMALHIKRAIASQYRYYFCDLYMNEYKDNAEVKKWLAHRIDELTLLLSDVQDAIDKNQPDYTGVGWELGWPETGEQFVPETVIPVTPMPETAIPEA